MNINRFHRTAAPAALESVGMEAGQPDAGAFSVVRCPRGDVEIKKSRACRRYSTSNKSTRRNRCHATQGAAPRERQGPRDPDTLILRLERLYSRRRLRTRCCFEDARSPQKQPERRAGKSINKEWPQRIPFAYVGVA
ncbi:hypothetical protein MTO96_022292 [Rhipicephalus appendiculatus]